MRLSDLSIPSAWVGLFIGLGQMAVSITAYPNKGYFWDVPVPADGEVILFFLGLGITLVSMRAILRGEGRFKKPVVDEEQIAKSKVALENMYFRKYGKLPEYPSEIQEETQDPETDATKPERKS